MNRNDFIDLINNEVTVSCSLPLNIPRKEIERITDYEANYFYKEYKEAVEYKMCLLNLGIFYTPEFKANRIIQFPDCIVGINRFMELKGGQRVLGINDPDFNFDRIMSADLYLSPWSSDTIAYRTMQWSFWSLTRSFILTDIQFKFNSNTHRLQVLGRDPENPVYVEGISKIPMEDLYEDHIFQRWVVAKTKMQLGKILGTFSLNLIGGVTINYGMYSDEGKQEISELKEMISGKDVADWFISFD